MKIIRLFLQVAFTIAFVFISVGIYSASVQPQTTLVSQARPAAPRTPLPPNKTLAGGGLDPNSSCQKTNKQLRALVPERNPVLTTSEYPTFLFYVPYDFKNIRVGEFSLLVWPGEETELYRTRFTLPETPGIVSISLSSSREYALKTDQFYHWYIELYCQENTSSTADLDINGFVQRVAATPERERQISIASPDIWYDALAKLAASPQEPTWKNKWVNLLKSIDAQDLVDERLVGAVLPIKE